MPLGVSSSGSNFNVLPPIIPNQAASPVTPAPPQLEDNSGAVSGLGGEFPFAISQAAKPVVPGPATTGGAFGTGGLEEPANPGETTARHILDALGGSAGKPMDWAKSVLAGGLAAAANVGKVPPGAGWLAGAARGTQGLVEQKGLQAQQEFERQEKLKADARAQAQLENEAADSKARRALMGAQEAAAIQTRNFDAERQPHLLKSDDLNERKLGQEIQKSENDLNQVDIQTHAAFIASGGTEEQWDEATSKTVSAAKNHPTFMDGMMGKNGMVVHNEEPHTAGNDEGGLTHITDEQRNKTVPNPEGPNWKGYIRGYTLDKEGDPQPIYVKPSTGMSLNDVIAFGAAAKLQRAQLLDDQKQKLDLRAKAAQTNEANARAELTRKQAAQLPGGNVSLSGTDYLNSLPASEKAIVTEIGTGKMAPERMSYLLSRNQKLAAEVAQAYPDFDSSKAQSYISTYKDFTSGKTSIALNSGGTALLHLKELNDLNTSMSHIPHSPAWTAYQNKAETVATELAKFYGDSTIPAIAAIKDTLTSTLPGNRRAAITTQAKSMGDKLDSYEQQWKNAAPSAHYQAPMPGVSQQAKDARAALDPNYADRVIPAPASHVFDSKAWAAANPGKDVNGAIAQAKQQGYEIKQ